ncbi:hypothetical protein FRB99_007895 [Tulasnella sp. 403]|nr:hypothetical protein FRB99_007895 [Tulasnella sp. 403]
MSASRVLMMAATSVMLMFLKYLIPHYNKHSGKRSQCRCGKSYSDPSRTSRCQQSHGKHFGCPVTECTYSNARADIVKQHCKNKHPNLGSLLTSQLPEVPLPMDPSISPTVQSGLELEHEEYGTESVRHPKRGELRQQAERRRHRELDELRRRHIILSGLSEQDFYATVPGYPWKDLSPFHHQGPHEPSPPLTTYAASSSPPYEASGDIHLGHSPSPEVEVDFQQGYGQTGTPFQWVAPAGPVQPSNSMPYTQPSYQQPDLAYSGDNSHSWGGVQPHYSGQPEGVAHGSGMDYAPRSVQPMPFAGYSVTQATPIDTPYANSPSHTLPQHVGHVYNPSYTDPYYGAGRRLY